MFTLQITYGLHIVESSEPQGMDSAIYSRISIISSEQNREIISITSLKSRTTKQNLKNSFSLAENDNINRHWMLMQKYFLLWRQRATKNKLRAVKLTQSQVIDKFLNTLKEKKEKDLLQNNSCICNKINETPSSGSNKKLKAQNTDCYKSRYKAQQNIIATQKAKLLEKEHEIENLKLGFVQEELEKSCKNSQYNIEEIFGKCSTKVKCKTAPPAVRKDDIYMIEIKCNKAPKILQKMQKLAQERALKRQMISERKRMADSIKKKQVEEVIENKRIVDEELKQKNLQILREKRRKDVERTKITLLMKKKYLESVHKADRFYKKKLTYVGFSAFKQLIVIKEENKCKSRVFYEDKLKQSVLDNLKIYAEARWTEKNAQADYLYTYKVCSKTFKSWHSILFLRKQSMQVAQDFSDMKLESKIFLNWSRYVCKQYMEELKKMTFSEWHYNSRLLLRCFYHWKSLRALLQLERIKEEQKMKWREKVWDVLPDYKPISNRICKLNIDV